MTYAGKFAISATVAGYSAFALATATPGLGWFSWAWVLGGFIGTVCGTTYATYILCKHCEADEAADAAEPLPAEVAPIVPDGNPREVEARVVDDGELLTGKAAKDAKETTNNNEIKPY